MNNAEGGYCPMCDTVWAAPGKCRCIVGKFIPAIAELRADTQYKELFEKDGAKFGTPLKIINTDKALDTNVYERRIWNEAIEAAALIAEHYMEAIENEIRKLKK